MSCHIILSFASVGFIFGKHCVFPEILSSLYTMQVEHLLFAFSLLCCPCCFQGLFWQTLCKSCWKNLMSPLLDSWSWECLHKQKSQLFSKLFSLPLLNNAVLIKCNSSGFHTFHNHLSCQVNPRLWQGFSCVSVTTEFNMYAFSTNYSRSTQHPLGNYFHSVFKLQIFLSDYEYFHKI